MNKKTVELHGSTTARIWTKPLRKLSSRTSLGYAICDYATCVFGMELYPWQEWALKHAFEIVGTLPNKWHFRYRTVLFLLSRQNGKTELSKIIASFFLNVLRVRNVFGTSLSLDKAEEVWEAVIREQERHPDLAHDIENVARRNGGKRLVLRGGRVYKVGAPTRRAGRGDSNDLVLLDEIREHRDFETWTAAAASINARPNGIIVCFSNAGDPDSVVLRQIRAQALGDIADFGGKIDGGEGTIGLFEWSSPNGAKTNDLKALAQGNPALGYGNLTVRALMANRAVFPESKFRSECMCQQVETILPTPFPDGSWDAGIDETSSIAPKSELYYGIDLSDDRGWCSIGVCGLREDGNWHIEVVARRSGTAWAEDWFRTRAFKGKMNLAFQGRGAPVSGLAEQLCTIPNIVRCSVDGCDLTNSWGRFWDGIAAFGPGANRGGVKIFHLPQPVMDQPAKTMQLRNLGGGVMLPDRKKSPDDIAPLYCCIMAFAAATKVEKNTNKIFESAYAREGYNLVFA